jgi:cysteinyl-tRNA synthetase
MLDNPSAGEVQKHMAFTLYDSRAKKQIPFEPMTSGHVSLYHCGPTVYSTAHIGNFRSFLFADTLRRYLEYRGFSVNQVMNITDVGHLTEDDRADSRGEDKLQKAAAALGWDPYRVARHFEAEFHADRQALGILPAHVYPRATEHIPDMLVQIQQLLDRGHAYIPEGTGDVYYAIDSFPDYGQLSGKNLSELDLGARIAISDDKKHPADFALWKTDPGHLMQWDPHAETTWDGFVGTRPQLDPRIGRGFPGWHIECSAMSLRYLGTTFDIHTGGEDNVFPHHECEIAQACGATDGLFARHWMHTRFLLVNQRKMSKREGTLFTLEDLKQKGFTPSEVRYLLVSNHYRQPMNFTLEGLDAARASIARLQTCRDLLQEGSQSPGPLSPILESAALAFEREFTNSLDDDLNVSNALASLYEFVSIVNREKPTGDGAVHALSRLDHADSVLGVLNRDVKVFFLSKEELDANVSQVIDVSTILGRPHFDATDARALAFARHDARKSKNFSLADTIRDRLKDNGVVFEDTPKGVRVKLP